MAKPLFIIGTGRSGTTLLRALLNAHPDLHISKESSFYLGINSQAFQRQPWLELQRYFRSATFAWLQLDSAALVRRFGQRPSRRLAFQTLMQADAERYQKSAWGDKTPAHWMCLPEIYADFPEAVVVHLVRDPRRVVASLLKMPWAPASVLANAFYCERTLKTVLAEPRVRHLRFEDLLAQPRHELKTLLDALELPWSERVLQHQAFSPDDLGGIPWLQSAQRPLRPAESRDGFGLSSQAQACVELLCPSAFEHFGYQTECVPQPALVARQFRREWPELLQVLGQFWRLRRADFQDPESELRAWLNLNPGAFAHWPGWDPERVIEASFAYALR